MSLIDKLLGKKPAPAPAQDAAEQLWQSVYDARAALYAQHFGPLPDDILKIMDLSGSWPGGGLYAIPADKLGNGKMVYATFGLANPDMPAELMPVDVETRHDEQQRPGQTSFTLKRKDKVLPKTDRPGYGYELIVVSDEQADWPLYILQWAARAEVINDVDIRTRVEQYNGLTVEQIQVGRDAFVNLLFTKAQAPLVDKLALPNGEAQVIVATVITDDEMLWSKQHGRLALLQRLFDAGVGQVSRIDRPSVVANEAPATSPGPVLDAAELAGITSREAVLELAAKGRLYKTQLFPGELGGDDSPHNALYIPFQSVASRAAVVARLRQAVGEGAIDSLTVNPEYKGQSHIPAKLHFEAKHSATGNVLQLTADIW